MKHLRTFIIACVVSAGLTACGDTGNGILAPAEPRLNGFTFGSGHRTASDTTTTTAATSGETTADEEVTERGGFTFGSGH